MTAERRAIVSVEVAQIDALLARAEGLSMFTPEELKDAGNGAGRKARLAARLAAVLNHHDHSRIESPLRFVDGGQSWTFGGDNVLNGDLGSVRLENWVPIRVFARGHCMAQDEKVRDLGRRDETHEVEIKV